MMRSLLRRLRCERGDALIEGLLAFGLVLLVVAFTGQAIAYVHARNVAEAAAQDGASAASSQGPQAGIARAQTILGAAGGAGAALQATAAETPSEVTVTVQGQPPKLFSLPLVLPGIHVEASLPLEQYPSDEQAATP
jgi:Flp pilus assembly protein TadG